MSEEEEYLSDEDEELELPPWTEGLEVRLDRVVWLYRDWVGAGMDLGGWSATAWLLVWPFVFWGAPGRVGVAVWRQRWCCTVWFGSRASGSGAFWNAVVGRGG
jgi:hypothetical protein